MIKIIGRVWKFLGKGVGTGILAESDSPITVDFPLFRSDTNKRLADRKAKG